MSHAATNWAIQRRGLKPTTKIVLWHLCDRFNPDYGCFPSQERLAHDCEISRAGLNTHLGKLETHGLLRRVRRIDPTTKQQMSTRYILGFEEDYNPPAPRDSGAVNPENTPLGAAIPCPESGHGSPKEKVSSNSGLRADFAANPCLKSGHGAVSRKPPDPCPEKAQSRVQILDTNLVREPLSKPVKEEEDAQAREGLSSELFEKLLKALGLNSRDALPAWWQGSSARAHIQSWRDDLGLTEGQIVEVATETRSDHPAPPDGPKALDRAMERAAQRLAQGTSGKAGRQKTKDRRKLDDGPRPSPEELAAFYADLVNSDKYLPASMISNVMRDAMLARGLVTPDRLQMRGVR